MTRPRWRLVSVWEGEPVGVDQKRPLIGFAVVTVLCAVLMVLSVGRGWSADFLRPGKPIAAATPFVPVDEPVPSTPATESATASIPDELSAQPLAVTAAADAAASPGRAGLQRLEKPRARPPVEGRDEVREASMPTTEPESVDEDAEKDAERAAGKAERDAATAAEKAERDAARAAAKAERDAAKAAAKAERDAAKAAAKAER